MNYKLTSIINSLKNLPQNDFFQNRLNLSLVAAAVVLLVGGVIVLAKINSENSFIPLEEVDINFDPEGPYALVNPRKDGNAINLSLTRVSSYDAFSYELVYAAEGVDRGAGDPKTFIEFKDKKSEYTQEILFGTCSKGATADPAHCVFDKGVENGTLTLRFKKDKLYKMFTTWHLQRPDVALGKLSSGDGHFNYQTTAAREQLVKVGYTIINDLTGVPKLPEGKQVIGKAYAINVPQLEELPAGDVSIEQADTPSAEAKIYRYISSENKWEELTTKIDGSTLSAKANGAGIFAVLINKE